MPKTAWVRLPSPPTSYGLATALGIFGAVLYLVLAYAIAVWTGPEFTGGSYGSLLLYSFISVGIPLALWFCYGLWGPLALMSVVILFWHVVVPLFGSEGDGTPVFALAVAMAPLYLLGYVVTTGLEFWLR